MIRGRRGRAGSRPVAIGPQRSDGEADQALALVDHGPAVLVPVGVLAGDPAEVLDQGLERLGQVEHLGRRRRPAPTARSTRRRAPAPTPRPVRRRFLTLARSGYVETTIRPSASTPPVTGDSCGRAVGPSVEQHDVVPGPHELEQARPGRRWWWWRWCGP